MVEKSTPPPVQPAHVPSLYGVHGEASPFPLHDVDGSVHLVQGDRPVEDHSLPSLHISAAGGGLHVTSAVGVQDLPTPCVHAACAVQGLHGPRPVELNVALLVHEGGVRQTVFDTAEQLV